MVTMAEGRAQYQAAIHARYSEVIRLREAGMTFQQIGERFGFRGRARAHALYHIAKAWQAATSEEIDGSIPRPS